MPRLAPYKIGVTLGWVSDMNGRPAALNLIWFWTLIPTKATQI